MKNITETIQNLSGGNIQDAQEILNVFEPVHMRKNQYLLKEGQICSSYYFIESGTVRLFHTKDSNEYTVWMGTAGEFFTNLESYLDGSKSKINIHAIEPSLVYIIDKRKSDILAKTSNHYNTLLRKTVEMAFVGLSKNIMSYQSEEAIERYHRLMDEKNWIEKYPLKYLSSFIGITQSTLSRIRAKKG
ncbi:MAG: Crp/Fnr family transcriptional regulator [Bacteroidota bacterium]